MEPSWTIKDLVNRLEKVLRQKIQYLPARERVLEQVRTFETSQRPNFRKLLNICEKYDLNVAYFFNKSDTFRGYKEQDLRINLNMNETKFDSAYRSSLNSYIIYGVDRINLKTLFKYANLIERDPYELIGGK